MAKDMIKNVSIIGLGFIGGSLGLSIKRNHPDVIVTGIDKGSIIIRAKSINAIDNGCLFSEMEDGIKNSDIVFITASIANIKQMLHKILRSVKDGAIVTDTAVTKLEISKIASKYYRRGVSFIGGHPVVGDEWSNINHSNPYLFLNNAYALTSFKNDNPESLNILKDFLEEIGANIITLTPEEHDDITSGLNHILQLIAIALVNAFVSKSDNVKIETAMALTGKRFRQFTEDLLMPAYIWEDIISSNCDFISKNIDRFIKKLEGIKKDLKTESFDKEYEKAMKSVKMVPRISKGFNTALFNLYVMIKDETGSIAKVASTIASGGFDIRDIGVVKIKEGEACKLRIAFRNQNVASKVLLRISICNMRLLTLLNALLSQLLRISICN